MKFVDNPENFNSDASLISAKYGGCVGSRACVQCGAINNGTCLCMGIFTCTNCKTENNPWKNIRQPISIPLANDFPAGLPEPEQNYKISDSPYSFYTED